MLWRLQRYKYLCYDGFPTVKIVSAGRGQELNNATMAPEEHRSITFGSENNSLLIDLATSTVTEVQNLDDLDGSGARKVKVLSGFLDGRSDAKFVQLESFARLLRERRGSRSPVNSPLQLLHR